jgi:hypothetical protein
MSNVVPDGTPSYFQFKSHSASFTSSGALTSLAFNYNSQTGVTTPHYGYSPGATGIGMNFRTVEDKVCGREMSFEDLGIYSRGTNVHFSYVYAGANMTSGACSVVAQTMKAVNGEITRGPFVSFNLTLVNNPKNEGGAEGGSGGSSGDESEGKDEGKEDGKDVSSDEGKDEGRR